MRKTKTDIKIESIERAIRIAEEKDLRCKEAVVNHYILMIDTLIEQEALLEETLS